MVTPVTWQQGVTPVTSQWTLRCPRRRALYFFSLIRAAPNSKDNCPVYSMKTM